MFNGAKVEELRKTKGMSKAKLSFELGVSEVMQHYIEKGLRQPSSNYVYNAAKFFGVKTDDLFADRISPSDAG